MLQEQGTKQKDTWTQQFADTQNERQKQVDKSRADLQAHNDKAKREAQQKQEKKQKDQRNKAKEREKDGKRLHSITLALLHTVTDML